MQEDNILTKKQRREARKKERLMKNKKFENRRKIKLFFNYSVIFLLVIGVVVGFFRFIANQPILPPSTVVGHIEENPPSHFLTQAMDIRVHKHMLEHADGSGPAGVIINYNCEDFECEPELLDKLRSLVREYPDNLYVAPYPNMSAKLVITKFNQQSIMDRYDQGVISKFLDRN